MNVPDPEIIPRFDRLEEEFLAQEKEKPRVGYLCLRVPPEILEAAGAIPLRIVSPESNQSTSAAVRTDACSFCRSVSAGFENGSFRDLDAVIGGACCDQMRRLLDTLARETDKPVILFPAPRTWNADRDYFAGEMRAAFRRISDLTGHQPDSEELFERIRARNQLKKRILDLRRKERLSGKLLHSIAASPLPPERILSFLEQIEDRRMPDASLRLLLLGSIPGGWEIDLVEESGARIVSDATCLGDRACEETAAETGDPWMNLYDTYVEKNNCPHRRPVTPLFDYVKTLIRKRPVDGIIFRSVKYCHPWGLLGERMKKEFSSPILRIDDDLSSPAMSGFRTRIGAFIEMLEARKARRA